MDGTITEQTLIPIGMFLAGLAMAVSGGIMYGRTKGDIANMKETNNRHDKEISMLSTEMDRFRELSVPLERRLTTIEVSLGEVRLQNNSQSRVLNEVATLLKKKL